MAALSDREIKELLIEDAPRGWRAFIDQHTPTLLALIDRAGVMDRDEAMDLYLRVCQRLAENDCARLRRHDPAKGSLAAWLAVVLRRVAVDWVRSRAGRRRVFAAVKHLGPFERRVFELFYWDGRTPSEIAEMVRRAEEPASLVDVLDALDRVQDVLSERHRSELLSLGFRSRAAAPLEDESGALVTNPPDERADPETTARAREIDDLLASALGELPPEDAAIVRLKYVHGLTHRQIEGALHLGRLTDDRVKAILARLRQLVARRRIDRSDAAVPGLAFLEGGS